MKKIVATAVVIVTCAALCTPAGSQDNTGEEVPTEAVVSVTSAENTEVLKAVSPVIVAPACDEESGTEEITAVIELSTDAIPKQIETAAIATSVPKPALQGTMPSSTDSYHTDIYPENVYSEELLYDADGNLIGKTITLPTEFGADTIWIDGHAYYDIPGFGLIEWSGPSQRTEDYTMYESGVKVGIMGGENESMQTPRTSAKQPENCPEPTGEVIDQTVSTTPERNGTPPNYKPDTTPPDDPNARIVP